ncbi:MAG: PaaI family thioesterase [Clostridia bacterium]
MSRIEQLKQMMAGKLAAPPISELIGFQLVQLEEGMTVFEMETSERHYNPMGTVHGGILGDLADAAMGMALVSTLAENETMTTIELKINFLKPIWKGKLRAVGKLIKKGSTIALLECQVYDEKNSLVAHSTSTCMILRGEKGAGR